MAETITCTQVVQLGSGLTRTVTTSLPVEAYDVIHVNIADAASDEEVQVQPGGAGQLRFLLIEAEPYGAQLTYKVNEATASETHQLDSPQIFMGEGALRMLSAAAPATLLFSNALGKTATVRILVGRTALV